MAKFRFIYWLLEFLESQNGFIFEWDDGNTRKSEDKHGATPEMLESCFMDTNYLALGEQYQPIVNVDRYGLIAKGMSTEIYFICFTIRDTKIRPISARLANKKERRIYDE